MPNSFFNLLPFLTMIALGISIGGIFALSSIVSYGEFIKIIVELLGAFSVTFLGLYASNLYSKKQDNENKKRESDDYYKSALVLISSELDFNEDILSHLLTGINEMPKIIKNYYSQFAFLTEVAKPIKSSAFYSTFYTQSIHEIINNLDLFNLLQQAYFNTELAVNGLYLTQDAHKEYVLNPNMIITPDLAENSQKMIEGDIGKITRAIELIRKAKQMSNKELEKYKLNFTTENSN